MDFFTMKILHKIMPLGFNGTFTNVWITIVIPSCTSNTSNQFFVQCKMHIYCIWILITLFLYKSNSNFLQVDIFTYQRWSKYGKRLTTNGNVVSNTFIFSLVFELCLLWDLCAMCFEMNVWGWCLVFYLFSPWFPLRRN